jgi:sulfatase maturation enzyme AslB (radical SAM superfamily)
MLLQMAKRMLLETDKRLLWKLFWNMGFKGALSIQRHKARLKRGEYFPPFLYVSIINSCNLRCQGCWVDVASKQETTSPEAFHKLVREARQMGNSFFGIVGGEPFMQAPATTRQHLTIDQHRRDRDRLRRTPRSQGCVQQVDGRRA